MIIRPAVAADAAQMADLLNQIIAIGGTTAHEVPKSADTLRDHYITGPQVVSSVVAVVAGQIAGWQSVELAQGEGHIGTFVSPGLQARGVGAALFALTCDTVAKAGVASLVATIRADNEPGLRYYARMGFADFAADPGFALATGQVVGRVHRRFHVV